MNIISAVVTIIAMTICVYDCFSQFAIHISPVPVTAVVVFLPSVVATTLS